MAAVSEELVVSTVLRFTDECLQRDECALPRCCAVKVRTRIAYDLLWVGLFAGSQRCPTDTVVVAAALPKPVSQLHRLSLQCFAVGAVYEPFLSASDDRIDAFSNVGRRVSRETFEADRRVGRAAHDAGRDGTRERKCDPFCVCREFVQTRGT